MTLSHVSDVVLGPGVWCLTYDDMYVDRVMSYTWSHDSQSYPCDTYEMSHWICESWVMPYVTYLWTMSHIWNESHIYDIVLGPGVFHNSDMTLIMCKTWRWLWHDSSYIRHDSESHLWCSAWTRCVTWLMSYIWWRNVDRVLSSTRSHVWHMIRIMSESHDPIYVDGVMSYTWHDMSSPMMTYMLTESCLPHDNMSSPMGTSASTTSKGLWGYLEGGYVWKWFVQCCKG